MKTAVVFLSGLAIALTGALIRSCQAVPAEFLDAWCGATPRSLAMIQQGHCAGCALAVVGLLLMAASAAVLAAPPTPVSRVAQRMRKPGRQ